MKIVLVGYMGSGKSTIGKCLSKDLKINFLDLDAYIEESLGETVSTIFKDKGELFFRKKEHEYLQEILEEQDNFVLSTGGGTPCYGNNMETIAKYTGTSFYLKNSISELVDRLEKEKSTRPLIKHLLSEDLPEFIGKHLFERSYYYMQSNYTINASDKSIDAIVDEIKTLLV
ncbi:MAG: shikimate kinase [Cellulophaga sp.]